MATNIIAIVNKILFRWVLWVLVQFTRHYGNSFKTLQWLIIMVYVSWMFVRSNRWELALWNSVRVSVLWGKHLLKINITPGKKHVPFHWYLHSFLRILKFFFFFGLFSNIRLGNYLLTECILTSTRFCSLSGFNH